MAKTAARVVRQAYKEADCIWSSLLHAGDAATEATSAGITNIVRDDAPLMHRIAALLRNPEWRGVLETSMKV